MTIYHYKIPADRYKNAQPLMVPFYGVEESAKESISTPKPKPMTKSHIAAANSQKTSTTQPPVAEGQQRRATFLSAERLTKNFLFFWFFSF